MLDKTYQQKNSILTEHMLIENEILIEKGIKFRKIIIDLKSNGIKTEPAFANLLGLTGNPYLELLKLEK